MCELLLELKFTDWLALVQSIVAIFTVYLLYKTFKSQERVKELGLKQTELESRAKRAEYLPVISGILDPTFPVDDDGYGGSIPNYNKNEISFIITRLIVNKNSLQLVCFESLFEDENNNTSIEPGNNYEKTIFQEGSEITITTKINISKIINLNRSKSPQNYALSIPQHLKLIILEYNLTIIDMIGNKYRIHLKINNLKTVSLQVFEITK